MAEMTENLLRLRSVAGVGPILLWRLIRRFGDSDGIFGADAGALAEVKGVSREMARRILEAVRYDPRLEMERAVRAGVDIIPYDDPSYPEALLHMFDPPVLLYVRGRLTAADKVAVGIVGTRNCGSYGRDHALGLSGALARGGYTVVSGLARGVDTFAHIGALRVGGRTVGVLGCGFDHMYPEENRDLALEMTERGAVVTEFSMATRPSRETFPARNRIIAGMGLGLLVIEAPLRSGSLITARLSNEIGRPVFAVPGRVDDPHSSGCNKLIRDGAVIVTSADDIFRELNPALPLPEAPERRAAKPAAKRAASRPEASAEPAAFAEPIPERAGKREKAEKPEKKSVPRPKPRLTEEQSRVLSALTGDWTPVDDIIERSGVESGKVTATLALLRLMHLVEQGAGQAYRRR